MDNRALAFEIIIRYLSNETFQSSKREIYNSRVLKHCSNLGYSPFEASFRYSKDFGFIEKLENNSHWYIKSVDEICKQLYGLINNNRNIENDNQPLTVPLAFEIIIHEFSNDTDLLRSTTEIKEHVFETRNNREDSFKADSVLSTLRFLNHFGFADKTGRSEWCVKSIDDMFDQLRTLVRNRNIEDEGEDF